jgi:hypothetical protein
MKGPAGTRVFDLPDNVPKELSPASIEVHSEQQFRGKIKKMSKNWLLNVLVHLARDM